MSGYHNLTRTITRGEGHRNRLLPLFSGRWGRGWALPGCAWLFLFAVLMSAGCDEPAPPTRAATPTPAELEAGEAKFNEHCAKCHGAQARGTSQGPPLVHKIYEPSHHGDAAFYRAAANGVRAHHWNFGNMPAVPHATQEDVAMIIRYVRWLQRQAGIT